MTTNTQFPILELYETKKVIVEPFTEFAVHRFKSSYFVKVDKPIEEPKKFNNLKKLIILLVVSLILLTVAILALGLSSVRNETCKNSFCQQKELINKTLIYKKNCSYGSVWNQIKCDECGLSFVDPNVRIIGGTKALENSWPSQVYIIQNFKETYFLDGEFVKIEILNTCSGTLIDVSTILTVAHCMKENSFSYSYKGKQYDLMFKSSVNYPTFESTYTVYFGTNDMNSLNGIRNNKTFTRRVSRLIRHESYDSTNNLNDIALIKLSEPVELNKNVQLACLPQNKTQEYPTDNTNVWVAGWGAGSNFGEQSLILNNVKLKILPEWKCWNVLPNYIKNWESQICAGEITSEKKNTCNGDSGAGLLVKEKIGERIVFVVAGIVSMGEKCGNFNKFGIYTRTSFYIDWISAYLN